MKVNKNNQFAINMLARITFISLFLISLSVQSADIPLKFDDPQQQQRFSNLLDEFRCLKCQNQNLADSPADLAQDLRRKIHDMILEGRTDQEVSDFLVSRYGDFVLYRPPMKGSTWLLWFAPFILLLAGVVFVFAFARNRSRHMQTELSEEDKTQLARLLNEDREI